MLLPLIIAVVGVVCSVIGTFLIRTKENATQKSLLATLRKGTYTAAVLAAVIAAPVTYYIMGSWGLTSPFWRVWWPAAPSAILPSTTPPTPISPPRAWPTPPRPARHHHHRRHLLGMKSTAAPIVIIGVAIIVSFLAAGGS